MVGTSPICAKIVNIMLSVKHALIQIWKSPYMFVFIQKQYPQIFAFFILRSLELFASEVCKFFKLFTYLRVHISKSKRCFNVKSSTNYFHMKTKILAMVFKVLIYIFFNMMFFRIHIFQPCYGTHILDKTGTKTIL